MEVCLDHAAFFKCLLIAFVIWNISSFLPPDVYGIISAIHEPRQGSAAKTILVAQPASQCYKAWRRNIVG